MAGRAVPRRGRTIHYGRTGQPVGGRSDAVEHNGQKDGHDEYQPDSAPAQLAAGHPEEARPAGQPGGHRPSASRGHKHHRSGRQQPHLRVDRSFFLATAADAGRHRRAGALVGRPGHRGSVRSSRLAGRRPRGGGNLGGRAAGQAVRARAPGWLEAACLRRLAGLARAAQPARPARVPGIAWHAGDRGRH